MYSFKVNHLTLNISLRRAKKSISGIVSMISFLDNTSAKRGDYYRLFCLKIVSYRPVISTALGIAILATLGSFILSGCSRTTPPAAIEYDHSISPYHRVGKGESIASIAQKFHMDKMELVHLNGLPPPYRIFVGQKLLVKPTAISAKANPDTFDSPATHEGSVEMKGDVEVKTLEPIQGTESLSAPMASSSQAASSLEMASAPPATDVDADIEGDTEPKAIDNSVSKPLVPESAGAFRWPVKGTIIKGFKSGNTNNDGINISAPKGTPVSATNNGVIAHTGNQVSGLGNIILIKHANGYMSVYTHLDEIKVKKGQQIKAGEKIGTVGKTGNVKEPQLHFEIRNGKTPIDPSQYLH